MKHHHFLFFYQRKLFKNYNFKANVSFTNSINEEFFPEINESIENKKNWKTITSYSYF